MARSRRQPDDRFRPPAYSKAEWLRIVAELMLTPRQAEITGLIVQGYMDDEIARMLSSGRSTIREHFEGIARLLSARNRTHIAYRVLECYRRLDDSS